MRLRNIIVHGNFQSEWDTDNPDNRVLVHDVAITWEHRPDGAFAWDSERLDIAAGYSWDGASRPSIVGWAVPRWGVFSVASLVHDFCFGERPFLASGDRISRKMTDELYLEIMNAEAKRRVDSGWKAPVQIRLAEVMYRAVRWFGAPVWNKHDVEFRGNP